MGRTYVGEYIATSLSPIVGKKLASLAVPLKKVGDPNASPGIEARMYNGSGGLIYTSPTIIDPTTLTTSFTNQTFDFSTNTHIFVSGDSVGVYYDGTSVDDYVVAGYHNSNSIPNTMFGEFVDNEFNTHSSREFVCTMYE